MKKIGLFLVLVLLLTTCSSTRCTKSYLERALSIDPFGEGDFTDSIVSVWEANRGCTMGL